MPAPRKQRTNLPQALQSLDILVTDLTLPAADQDGHDDAIKIGAQVPPSSQSASIRMRTSSAEPAIARIAFSSAG
jgi:hypothetical protein